MPVRRGKGVLVTGATSGIGEATARALAARGHRVYAAGRRVDRLEALAARQPGVTATAMDVTDPDSVRAAVEGIARRGETVDVLVNNAGFAAIGPVEAVTAEEVRRQFDTNVFGLLEVTRAVLPAMRERRAGRIVNISSVSGRTTFPGTGVYGATKYAVEALSDALRAELRPHGVDVVVVEPGFVSSEIDREGVSPDALDGAYRPLAAATNAFLSQQIAAGAAPDDLATLLVRVVEARRPRTRYLFPAASRVLVGAFTRLPDRLADTLKLRAVGVDT